MHSAPCRTRGFMERVQVDIFGQVYSIKGGNDPASVRELAAFVDEKMKQVEKGTGTVDPLRVAILTALTIADELYQLREQCTAVETTAGSGVKRLLDLTEAIKTES